MCMNVQVLTRHKSSQLQLPLYYTFQMVSMLPVQHKKLMSIVPIAEFWTPA